MSRRYEMWAGQGNPEHLKWLFDDNIEEAPFPSAVWPIVDTETCGSINMKPRTDQWFAIAFDPIDQRAIYDALKATATIPMLTAERDGAMSACAGLRETIQTLTQERDAAYNEAIDAAREFLREMATRKAPVVGNVIIQAADAIEALKR